MWFSFNIILSLSRRIFTLSQQIAEKNNSIEELNPQIPLTKVHECILRFCTKKKTSKCSFYAVYLIDFLLNNFQQCAMWQYRFTHSTVCFRYNSNGSAKIEILCAWKLIALSKTIFNIASRQFKCHKCLIHFELSNFNCVHYSFSLINWHIWNSS